MNAIDFKSFQKRMRDEGLLSVSNRVGAMTVAVELLASALVLCGILRTDPWSATWCLLQVLGGVSLFRWFVILHECGHKTLFTRRWLNTLVGHLASVLCLIPYFAWRNVHLLHHRWVGVIDKDPTQKDLLRLQAAGNIQNRLFWLVWKLWLPIPFAKFLFSVFWGYPLACRASGDTRNARLGIVSCVACAVPHLAILVVVGPRTWATCFLPMLVCFYFLIENMNLPQHSELFPYLSETHPDPIPFAQQDVITRSTHLPNWLSIILALNFNRHTEHHLFPGAPWHALNRVRARLLDAGYRHPHEVRFLSFMWRFRRRDPLVIYRDALPRRAGGQQ
jgi:acyl-lipid omega-6 desaturase (Delta-12 desaturase)